MTCLTAPVDKSLELLSASLSTHIDREFLLLPPFSLHLDQVFTHHSLLALLFSLTPGNSEKDGKPVIQTFPKQSEAGATRKVEMTLTATYPSVGGFYTSCLRAARRHLDYRKRPRQSVLTRGTALWPYSSRGPDSWFTIDFRFLRVFADYSRLKAELLVCDDSNCSLCVVYLIGADYGLFFFSVPF
uniref:Uncharacterized protein n=1 Tax=Timema monikensis TaxID=170555 RepID=A0A7R9HN68_9NEOP|nr:unnamed protein product [Timema monikensis]